MNNKSLHRNVIPATAVAAAGTLTSQVENATYGKGIRFIITITNATSTGSVDSVFLCVVLPAPLPPISVPLPPVSVPIVGFAAANSLSVNGTYFADFYPGAWLPPTIAAGGALLGVAGIELPMRWSVQLNFGAGNAATVKVDGEMYP